MSDHNELSETIPSDNSAHILQQYQHILEAAGCCIFTLDAEGCLQTVSTSIQSLTGFSAAELIGTPFLNLVAPDWQDRIRQWQRTTSDTCEFPFPMKASKQRWVRYTRLPDASDDSYLLLGMLQDISSHRQTRQNLAQHNTLLRDIINTIPHAIDVKNKQGEFILSNPAHTHLLGAKSESDIVGKRLHNLMPGVMAVRYAKEDGEVIQNGLPISQIEQRGLPGDPTKWLSATKIPLKNDAGELMGVVSIAHDITYYKQREAELKQREGFYRTLARNLPQSAVFLYDREMRILLAEGTALNAVQFRHAAPEGQLFPDVLDTSTENMGEFLRVLREALNGNETRMERTYSDVYFRVHVIPVRNNRGEITAGMGLIQNIDEQKKFEQALRASEERNRALINALPDMLFVARRDGTITEFRPSFDNTLFAVATDTQTIHQVGLPDAIVDESLMYLELALETGTIQSFEFIQQDEPADERGDSGERSFEVRMIALNEEEVLALVRDMTTLKRIQEELSNHIDDLTIVRQVSSELSDNLNFNYVVQLALDAALRLSNAQAGFVAMIQPDDDRLALLSIIGQYDVQQVNTMFAQRKGIIPRVLQTQQPELIMDALHDPHYIPLLSETKALMIIPLLSHERMVGVLNLEARKPERFNQERFQFLQLITGRIAAFLDNANLYRQTQEQLQELQKLYEEVAHLEQLKTDMIRIASHDLKNPLSSIMGYLDMLGSDNTESLSEQQHGYLDNAKLAAKKMHRLTSGLLSLERVEQIAQQHNRERVNLRELLRRAVGEQMDFAVRKVQTVQQHLPEPAVWVAGDGLQLYEALVNLIGNAIKYTPENGTIDVSLHVEGTKAQVRVKDTGYGIPQDQQERLFMPFFRAKTRETRSIEGTGLGLHLVKNIIERHEGMMVFESIYGEGSTFGFDMPLLDKNAELGTLSFSPTLVD